MVYHRTVVVVVVAVCAAPADVSQCLSSQFSQTLQQYEYNRIAAAAAAARQVDFVPKKVTMTIDCYAKQHTPAHPFGPDAVLATHSMLD